jgi:hypothetical protein
VTTEVIAERQHRTTETADRPAPKLPQSAQRLLVGLLGYSTTMSVAFVAAGDRLTAAEHLDSVQAVELGSVRICLETIRDHSIALVRLDRAAEADRTRDEHVSWICKLVAAARRAIRRIARAIESALTGHSRPETGEPS